MTSPARFRTDPDAALVAAFDDAMPAIRQAVKYAIEAESADPLRRHFLLDLEAAALADAAATIGGVLGSEPKSEAAS